MTFLVITGLYLIARFYVKNIMTYLLYGNIALIFLSAVILSIGGIESAVSFGPYSLLLFIFMFIELSITYFRK